MMDNKRVSLFVGDTFLLSDMHLYGSENNEKND